jgi:nucleoid-associated protein YgaU
MEIIPIFNQFPLGAAGVLQLTAAACAFLTIAHYVPLVWLARPRLGLDLPSVVSLSTLPALVSPALAFAAPSRLSSNPIDEVKISPALDERVPPPLSLVGAGDIPSAHPAIHGERATTASPLFPRATRSDALHVLEPWERGAIDLKRAERMRRSQSHTKDNVGVLHHSHYAVMPGDTLWGIAEKVLGSSDPRAIARYWPRLHKENVDVIGRDPNLLRPGQVLSLPRTGS